DALVEQPEIDGVVVDRVEAPGLERRGPVERRDLEAAVHLELDLALDVVAVDAAHDGNRRARASSCRRRWLSTRPPRSSLCQVPSAPSTQAWMSSASWMSMISSSWSRRSGSATGA